MSIEKLREDIKLMEDDGWALPCKIFKLLLEEHEFNEVTLSIYSNPKAFHTAEEAIQEFGEDS